MSSTCLFQAIAQTLCIKKSNKRLRIVFNRKESKINTNNYIHIIMSPAYTSKYVARIIFMVNVLYFN